MPVSNKYVYDPVEIEKKKQTSFFYRLPITRYGGGKPARWQYPFGHYMFCGDQRQGKSSSLLVHLERVIKQFDGKSLFSRFHGLEKHKIEIYSNMTIKGVEHKRITKATLLKTLQGFKMTKNVIHVVILDEIHGYFPRDGKNKETRELLEALVPEFSQLGKSQTIVLSTAQVYGRLDKVLREQCLYMVACRRSKLNHRRFVNDYILGSKILCDDLGRWAGPPEKIYTHGLPNLRYITTERIRE